MTMATVTTTQVYHLFIKAPPERIWEAITNPGVHREGLLRVPR